MSQKNTPWEKLRNYSLDYYSELLELLHLLKKTIKSDIKIH